MKHLLNPSQPITSEERACSEIWFKLLSNETSILYLAPISKKMFIKNEEADMFVSLENRSANIINHIYSYNVYIENNDLYGKMEKLFNITLEQQRVAIEKEIRNNIKHSLNKVLENLNEKIQ